MLPLIGSLITGGASLLGSYFGSQQQNDNTQMNIAAQQQMQNQTQAFNSNEAAMNRQFQAENADVNRQFAASEQATNRAFQQQMSNTAFQRARSDMEAAGFNPILAARTGASTPSGGAASGSSAGGSAASTSSPNMAHYNAKHALEGLGDAAGKAVNTAVSLKTFEKMTEAISQIQADTAKSKAAEGLIKQQTDTEKHETHRRRAEAQKSEYDIGPKELSNEEARAVLNMPKWLRDTLYQGGMAGTQVAKGVSALPMLGSTARSIRQLIDSRWP